MTKPADFKRVNLSFDPKDWKMIAGYLERSEWRYLPKGTALRHILLQDVTARNSLLQGCNTVLQDVTCPDPDPAGAGTIPEKEQEQEEEQERKPQAAKRRKPPGLCPLPIAEKVIGQLNSNTGQKIRPSADSHRQLIQARMNEGATVEDLLHVINVMCAEWGDSPKMSKHLVPKTLFSKTNFENYVGKQMPPQGSLDLTTEAGRSASRAAEGWDETFKPRPRLKDLLAAKENDDATD